MEKQILSSPFLCYPNNHDEYTLTTGASLIGIGATLPQKQRRVNRFLANASNTLTTSQGNFSTRKREFYPVVKFTNDFKTYLLGREFVTLTDHQSLVWLYSFKCLECEIAKWFEKLWQLNLETGHNAGKVIHHADCLSQVQTEESCTTTFLAAFMENDTGIEIDTSNPWQVLQNTDRRSMKRKQ